MFGIDEQGQRKGYSNINFDIIAILPKYIQIITEMFDDIEFDVSLDLIDNDSIDKKKEEKSKLVVNSLFGNNVESLYNQLGIPNPNNLDGK